MEASGDVDMHENKLTFAALQNGHMRAGGRGSAAVDESFSSAGGFDEGVGVTMADVMRLQHALDEARRTIGILEVKLSKSEYRQKSMSNMLQDIPSTLQVAQAEKRVLEAKLCKQVETHTFAISVLRSDAQNELKGLHHMLETEISDKRIMVQQLHKQAEMVDTLTERLEKQRKASLYQDGVHAMNTFADTFATGRVGDSNTSSATHMHNVRSPFTSFAVNPAAVETLSSPQKGGGTGVGMETSEANDSSNSGMSASFAFTAPPSFGPIKAETNIPFNVPAYDSGGATSVHANERNYNRLQQMMLSIKK
jgi:hypothetical protein